jgi:hypothetical protein
MSEQNRSYLIDKFQDGDIPTGQDFADMIDSALNLLDDGLTVYKYTDPTGDHIHFGLGDTAPVAKLGIRGDAGNDEEMIRFTSSDGTHKWNINLNPTVSNIPGFSIDNVTSGTGVSCLFIDESADGKIGMGTVQPLEKLHIQGTADGNLLSAQIENLSTGHGGWLLSHVDDNAILERTGAFAIVEKDGSSKVERMTFLKKLGLAPNFYNNVGINETLPFATLHVTRVDVNSDVRLAENTGMLLLGPIDSYNLGMDGHAIQARLGSYVAGGPTLSFVPSQLDLQPWGGDIVVHHDYPVDQQVIITDTGLVGLGKAPIERLDINGAVTFGDTSTVSPAEGTVRWHGTPGDLEVFKNGNWQSLTTQTVTDGFWIQSAIAGAIYFEPPTQNAKVGIGVVQPTSALHVVENNQGFVSTSVTGNFTNTSTTATTDMAVVRVGLRVSSTGVWSPNPDVNNIGLYVNSVEGQLSPNANIGALINGNVVIGNLTGQAIVGANGTNVLAIQNGTAPTTHTGSTSDGGIQIYSAVDPTGVTSVFNIMMGDGTIIQLYQQAALPAEDFNNPNTGDVNTDILIKNMRDRIDALEARLQTLGLIL